jgi:hypothetical protein
MRRLLITATLVVAASSMAAQPNPFKVQKSPIKSAAVTYALSGDASGTASLALDGDRMAHKQSGTMKMMGKTTTTETWSLVTPDSLYNADLAKKQGTVSPNPLPYFAQAYDDLDGAGKKRLHQNMQDMGSMLAQAFGFAGLKAGEKVATKTYAGQECEERTMGSFTVCSMTKAPIALHTQFSLACFAFEETATEVKLASPPAEAFTAPAGITWKPDPHLQKPDSVAKGYVLYLASQQLADSIAKAKSELQAAQAKAGGTPTELTPEHKAAMQQACDAIKSFDLGKVMADATSQMAKELADAAKKAAMDAAKEKAKSGIKGLFGKPKIP